MKTYKIVYGDWSGDGHEKSDHFLVSTDATAEELQALVDQMAKLFESIDFCCDYEENSFTQEQLNKILPGELVKDWCDEFNYKYDEITMTEEIFPKLMVEWMKRNSPHAFTTKKQKPPVICASVGYGLF